MRWLFFQILALFCFFWLLAFPALPQESMRFQQATQVTDLVNNRVLAIQQDQDGFLWLLTERALKRYDGYEVKEFPNNFDFVLDGDLLLRGDFGFDSSGHVWVITESLKPQFLDPFSREFQTIPEFNSVTAMLEIRQGVFLFGTLSGQLYQWDKAKNSRELVMAKTNQEIVKLLRNPQKEGEILILFRDGIGRLNTKTQAYTQVFSNPTPSPEKFTTAYFDAGGKLWLGTFRHGLYHLEGDRLTKEQGMETWETSGIKSPVLDILEDKTGRIWVATFDAGIYVRDAKSTSWTQFQYQKNNSQTLASNAVSSLMEDNSGTIWIGTLGAGLSYYDSYLNQFQTLSNQNTPEGIHLENIQAIYADSSDKLWVGTGGKGLVSYSLKDGKWQSYSFIPASGAFLKSDWIESLSGIGNDLWISYTRGGLSRWNPQTGTQEYFGENTDPSLSAGQILKVYPAAANLLWLCTRQGGLLLFSPKDGIIKRFVFEPGIAHSFPDNHITALLRPEEEVVWVGTGSQGLIRLQPETGLFQQFRPNLQDSSSQLPWTVTSLAQSADQRIWVGTASHGLWFFDEKSGRWESPSALDLLKNSPIYGLSEDHKGQLWIATGEGILSLGSGAGEEYRLHQFGSKAEQTFSYGQGVFFQDPGLGVFIGGFDQILFFKGEDIRQNTYGPNIRLTKIMQGEEEVTLDREVSLGANQSDLTFYFSTLSFSAPDQSRFHYRLLGEEEEWRIQQGVNHVSYTNLKPGDYQFEVRGSNYNGVWSPGLQVFRFQIKKPWHQTLLMKILLAIGLTALLLFIYQHLKFRWFMKVKLELKDQEMARLLELDQLKSAFFGNISHEFRTPLALIMGPAERLWESSEDLVYKSKMKLILDNAKKLAILTDKILAIKKVPSERAPLQIKHGNLSLLIQSVLVNFSYLSVQKEVIIRPHIPLITEVWFDSDKMETLLENVIYLAIESSQTKSDIHFEAKLDKQNLTLWIVFQLDPQHRLTMIQEEKPSGPYSDPAGLHMKKKLIEKLVAGHQGTFAYAVNRSHGAKFRMDFSLDKYSYHPSFVQEDEESVPDDGNRHAAKGTRLETAASKILIVEDNKNLRTFLAGELGKSYEVVEAENGKTGLYEALRSNPDLILSDIMMPEIDGFELCEKIKTNELTSHIPLILLTAKIEEESQLLALQLGVDDYIQKPFSFQKLALRIEKLIELRNKLRVRYASSVRIAPSEITSSSLDEKFLQKVQKLVDEEMMESEFSIEQFCQRVGMSRMQLHRKLTALTGLSTSAFIRDQRLRLAVQKLEKTDETIAEIAYSVGFSSPSYFIKCFKESYQMTPLEYQKGLSQ